MKGKIKRLLKEKHCGFIKAADGKQEYFFHASALKNVSYEELQEGQDVDFEETESAKGPRAEDVYV